MKRRLARRAGFTVVEVMMATFVMALGISTSIVALQSGYQALDTARNTTLAAQIIQSELERIRLLPWSTTSTITDAQGNTVLKPSVSSLSGTPDNPTTVPLSSIFPSGTTTTQLANRFTIRRVVTDVADRNNEIKAITMTVTWKGIDGLDHTRTSTTQYAKNGLYDYYFTKADRRS
jgi:Tfp pilus assembly protein PilV